MKRFVLRRSLDSADRRAGFSLLEAMVALAIASLILSAIAVLGAQMMRNWMRGQDTIAALEMLQRGLGRLETDLSLAIPMRPPGSEGSELLFAGDATSITFPAATGFGAGNRGLELLAVKVTPEEDGVALVRRRGPVANLGTVLGDPVALLHGRMTMSFSYRDDTGQVVAAWANRPAMPSAVLVTLLGASGVSLFPAPLVIPLMTNQSVACLAGDGGDADAASGGDDGDAVESRRGRKQRRQQGCPTGSGQPEQGNSDDTGQGAGSNGDGDDTANR